MAEFTDMAGKALPSTKTVNAIRRGIELHGLVGLVNQTKITWSVVAAAGFGQPVKAIALRALEARLFEMQLLGPSAQERTLQEATRWLLRAFRGGFFDTFADREELRSFLCEHQYGGRNVDVLPPPASTTAVNAILERLGLTGDEWVGRHPRSNELTTREVVARWSAHHMSLDRSSNRVYLEIDRENDTSVLIEVRGSRDPAGESN